MNRFAVRNEKPEDIEQVFTINRSAFDSLVQPRIVDLVRQSGCPVVSLVATDAGKTRGHIMFSPVTLSDPKVKACQLSPVAVLPDMQGKGVGSLLIRAGLEACRNLCSAVFLVGNPLYYSRFGFKLAKDRGFTCGEMTDFLQYLELEAEVLGNLEGPVEFHPAFSEVDGGE